MLFWASGNRVGRGRVTASRESSSALRASRSRLAGRRRVRTDRRDRRLDRAQLAHPVPRLKRNAVDSVPFAAPMHETSGAAVAMPNPRLRLTGTQLSVRCGPSRAQRQPLASISSAPRSTGGSAKQCPAGQPLLRNLRMPLPACRQRQQRVGCRPTRVQLVRLDGQLAMVGRAQGAGTRRVRLSRVPGRVAGRKPIAGWHPHWPAGLHGCWPRRRAYRWVRDGDR